MLLRVADLDFVGIDMAFGMAVEELAQQRPARTLYLRHQHERLPHLDPVLQPHTAELAVSSTASSASQGTAGAPAACLRAQHRPGPLERRERRRALVQVACQLADPLDRSGSSESRLALARSGRIP